MRFRLRTLLVLVTLLAVVLGVWRMTANKPKVQGRVVYQGKPLYRVLVYLGKEGGPIYRGCSTSGGAFTLHDQDTDELGVEPGTYRLIILNLDQRKSIPQSIRHKYGEIGDHLPNVVINWYQSDQWLEIDLEDDQRQTLFPQAEWPLFDLFDGRSASREAATGP